MDGKRLIGTGAGVVLMAAMLVLYFVWPAGRQLSPEGDKPPPEAAAPAAEGAPARRDARPAAVAGSFYKGQPGELRSEVKGHLEAAEPTELGKVRGLVSPHAGYDYSGLTAAYGYGALEGRRYKTVIVIGATHKLAMPGASIPNVAGYKTPLGTVPLSPLADALRTTGVFIDKPEAHVEEHSIEVQLPFLQEVLGEFEFVPILIGIAEAAPIAEAILAHLDDETLIIASSDLSHHVPYAAAKEIDAFTVQTIADVDADLIELCQACGKAPVAVLLHIAREKGWRPHVLDQRNSGDTAGDKSRVVGYCSVAFTEEQEAFVPPERSREALDEAAQEKLLELARAALEAAVRGEDPPEPDASELPEALRRRGGAFVTLTKHGQLRGCIGHILPYEPLYESVLGNAASAALRDGRFQPVSPAELDSIRVEVSVLSVPERLHAPSPEALLERLVPGRDGVYLVVGPYTSTYLPQVWEGIPDKTKFMQSLAQKAGLRADTWKHPAARIFIYHAQVFEEEQGGQAE